MDGIDFTFANSVNTVLGFAATVITAPSASFSFFSTNTASFNRVNSYIIASNLVSAGIPVYEQGGYCDCSDFCCARESD